MMDLTMDLTMGKKPHFTNFQCHRFNFADGFFTMEVYPLMVKPLIWLFNGSPWKDPPIFKNGKPSISMGHFP